MSDIIVKELAELIGAPVESLLQQLKDADISVSGPDDSITDRQKLKLLESIRSGQAAAPNTAAPKKAGGKISLKKRSNSEINVSGAQGKTNVSVEVRRKKNFSRPASAPEAEADTNDIEELAASANRTNDLAEQLSNERKAREEAIEKSKADRQANSDRKAAEKTEKEEKAKEALDAEKTKTEDTTETQETETEAQAETKQEEVSAEVATPEAKEETETKKDEQTAEKPAPVKTTLELPKDPKERREFLAKRARDEAAALLGRRPSRPKPTPVAKPKETLTTKKPATPAPSTTANKGKKKPFQGRDSGPGQLHIKEGANRRNKKKGKRTRNVKIEQSTEHGFVAPTEPVVRSIEVPDTIVVSELAQMLSVKGADVIRAMMGMGVMATINQVVDQDTAILIVEEMGHVATAAKSEEEKSSTENLLEDTSQFEQLSRAPVVTIMGHVDHGKTSLLDYIRESRVASGEAGGITQHIGAYQVGTANGIISFLDTPGHAAFTQMRARGAKATDIVILVVAADDGVMPQTEEAIKHTREAGVPLIVAINKIDKEAADPEKVKSELSKFEVIPEDWGGEDVFANVSAKTGEGIDGLLESVLLVADMQELKARKQGPAKGTIVESSVVKGRGAVATVLVQEGTLKKGDIVLAGSQFGRIRAMSDDLGKTISEAGPSTPIEILGLSGTPSAGDDLIVLKSERRARELATMRHDKERESRFAAQQAAKLDAMFEKMQDGEKSTLNVLLKADVQGSLEAIKSSLNALSTEEVVVNIISSGVGGLSETDITLAQSSEAVIIGFNVRADASARRFAQESDTEIRYYSIIYELIDDVRDAMSGLLKPELREELIGIAEVKDVFTGSGFGNIAGCLVVEGKIKKDQPIRVLRKEVVIFEGMLESLRRHQDNVKEVAMGTECGIGVKNYDDVQPGDQIEVFTRTEIQRSL